MNWKVRHEEIFGMIFRMMGGKKTEERIQDKESLREGLICIIRIPKVKERNRAEAIFEEIVAGNFQKLLKDNKSRIRESLQTPSRSNKRKNRPRHIRVKQFKTSSKNWQKNHCQLRILYSMKISFENEGKVKTISAKGGWVCSKGNNRECSLHRRKIITDGNKRCGKNKEQRKV